MKPPFFSTDTAPDEDKLLAGEYPRVYDQVTLKQSATLYKRGHALGVITAAGADQGKYNISLAAAGDGSQVVDAVCVDDVDATAGDVKASVMLTGEFNAAAMTFGAGHTAASTKAALRQRGIFLKTNVVPA